MTNTNSARPALDDIARLKRLLYTSDELSDRLTHCVNGLVDGGKGEDIVRVLVGETTTAGDHPAKRQGVVISVLAICANRDAKTKQAAYAALTELCRTPTVLFQFLSCVALFAKLAGREKSGFGRVKRKAIAKWYNERSVADLASFVTKYRRRHNWSHVDLIRMAHTKPANEGISFIFKYATKGMKVAKEYLDGLKEVPSGLDDILKYLDAVETVKNSHDAHEVARLAEQFQLTREHIPTWFIKDSKEVWLSLVHHMPLDVILANLIKFASIGLLNPSPDGCSEVLIKRLESEELLKESRTRVHPFLIQMAMKSYELGRTDKTTTSIWPPNPDVIRVLKEVFYKVVTLQYEPTNSRYVVAVDVSASMFNKLNGGPLLMSSVWAAASMSVGILRAETGCQVLAFVDSASIVDGIEKDVTVEGLYGSLEKLKKEILVLSNLSTPVSWALEKKKSIDVFLVFTDCYRFDAVQMLVETFRKYRDDMKLPSARLAIVSYSRMFVADDFDDVGVLLLSGVDVTTPEIVRSFVAGKFDS